MNVGFKSSKMQKLCNSSAAMNRELGEKKAQKLKLRLGQLAAVETLQDMCELHKRCHQLKHDRDEQFAVDLDHPYRLIFEPTERPIPRKSDGGIDLASVNAITVLEIVNYH